MNLRKEWKYLVGAFLGIGIFLSTGIFLFFPDYAIHTMADYQLKKLGMKRKTIEVDGSTICYVEGGKGQEKLLLVHGFLASKAFWTSYIPAFYEQYHILAVDLPGHGESEKKQKGQSYDIKSMGLFLDAFIRAVEWEKIHLLGSSMGGGAALAYASDHSENIKSLALINPLAVQPPFLSEVQQALLQGQNLLLPRTMEDFYRTQEVLYGARLQLNPFLAKLILNSFIKNRSFYLQAFEQMVEKGGIENCLSRVTAPVLVLQGDQDRVVDASCVALLLKYIPKAKVVWVRSGAHNFTAGHRRYAEKAISQFFSKEPTLLLLKNEPAML